MSHLVDPIFGYYNQFSPFTTYFTWDWGITSDDFMCDMITRVRLDFNGGSVKPPLLMACLCKSTHVHVFSCGCNYVYVPNGLTFVSKRGPWISYLPRSIHERLRGGIHDILLENIISQNKIHIFMPFLCCANLPRDSSYPILTHLIMNNSLNMRPGPLFLKYINFIPDTDK